MRSWRWLAAGLLFLLAGQFSVDRALRADEIDIVAITPSSGSVGGLPAWPDGTPMPALTASNSITVQVRYQTDGDATEIQAFVSVPSGAGFQVATAGVGSIAPCEPIRGFSMGRCATAIVYVCEEGSTDSITIEEVAASLYDAAGTELATDRLDVDLQLECGATVPAPTRSPDCMVLGVPGEPEPVPLPFGRETPICRCLQDEPARELRCTFLHPDFFMVRRIPFPLPPGQQYEETWDFLPLTELQGVVEMRLSGGGLAEPVTHLFGEGQAPPNRFVARAQSPEEPIAGRAMIEYDSLSFRVDRTIDQSLLEQE